MAESVIDTSPKARLVELGRHVGVGLDDIGTKEFHVAGLRGSHQLRLHQLVSWMERDKLRRGRRRHGLRRLKRDLHEAKLGGTSFLLRQAVRVVIEGQQREEMDRAELRAYGWSDLPVPPFFIKENEDKAALQAFDDEVIDRLFIFNKERGKKVASPDRVAKKGEVVGKTAAKTAIQVAKNTKTSRANTQHVELGGVSKSVGAQRKKGAPPEGQGSLF